MLCTFNIGNFYMACIVLVSASCVFSAFSAVLASACTKVPPCAQAGVRVLGPYFLFDLIQQPNGHKADTSKNATDNGGEEMVTLNPMIDANGTLPVSGHVETNDNGFRIGKDDEIHWNAVGALADRIFFVVHFVAIVVVVITVLVYGYYPWRNWDMRNKKISRPDQEYVCFEMETVDDPYKSECLDQD